MKLNEYKHYVTCSSCGKTIPRTRLYFRRNIRNGKDVYHEICRECEDKYKNMSEWKDGLLLCHKCHQYKSEDMFTPNSTKNSARHFRRHICNECNTKRQMAHDVNLPDNKKLEKCLRFRLLGARDRSHKNNIEFNLSLSDLLNLWEYQNGKCALSGIDMTFELKKGRIFTNVSIDRIDKNLGYVIDNIQLVCMACNQIKSDMSDIEMYNFCKKIIEHYENKNNINH